MDFQVPGVRSVVVMTQAFRQNAMPKPRQCRQSKLSSSSM